MQAETLLRSLFLRVPSPVQKVVASSLDRLVRRWPALSRLVGIVSEPIAPESFDPDSLAPESFAADSFASDSLIPAPIAPPKGRADAGAPSERDECLECLRACNDSTARASAARALSRIVDREATFALVVALRDPTAEVAVEAAEALRFHPVELVAPALRHVVDNRDRYFSPTTRAAAVRTLGALLPPGGAAAVVSAVADVDASVSLAAVAALAERDEAAGAQALLTLLEDGTGFYVPLTRQAAARGLAQMGHRDEGRIDALLRQEADPAVREALASVRLRAS